jgi:hypothetical protein
VEGVNFGGLLLTGIAILVVGGASLVAFGLLIARLTKAARTVIAVGLLCAAVIAALASLSFLGKEFHYAPKSLIVLTALSLLLAGAGQFAAALRSPGSYAAALGCVGGSMVFVTAALLDDTNFDWGEQILSLRNLSLAGASLLLAVASVVIAVLRPRRSTGALLWTAQALLGAIAGFAMGDACIRTRYMLLDPERTVGDAIRVRLEVYLLGLPVSEENGLAHVRERGPSSVRFIDEFPRPPSLAGESPVLALTQPAWVYGTPAVGAAAGLLAALAIALLLRADIQ